jgi:hypothetical protein
MIWANSQIVQARFNNWLGSWTKWVEHTAIVYTSDGARKFIKPGQNLNFKQKSQFCTKNLNFEPKILVLPKIKP